MSRQSRGTAIPDRRGTFVHRAAPSATEKRCCRLLLPQCLFRVAYDYRVRIGGTYRSGGSRPRPNDRRRAVGHCFCSIRLMERTAVAVIVGRFASEPALAPENTRHATPPVRPSTGTDEHDTDKLLLPLRPFNNTNDSRTALLQYNLLLSFFSISFTLFIFLVWECTEIDFVCQSLYD